MQRLAAPSRFTHFDEEVGSFAGTLAHAGEHRHTAVLRRHAGDHLLDEHGLADAGTTEQTDLAALFVGSQQVDDLDACLEHLGRWLELVEVRRWTMNIPVGVDRDLGGWNIEGFTHDVPDMAEGGVANRHLHAVAGVAHLCTADKAIGWLHRDGSNTAVTDLLSDLERDENLVTFELNRQLELLVDLWEVSWRELHVHHRTGNSDDAAWLEFWFGDGHTEIPSVCSRVVSIIFSASSPPSASAPLTISMISVVIDA